MFRLKPTRMTLSDHRPSLSYRLTVDEAVRGARNWVEIALANDPGLFLPDAVAHRTPSNFVTFRERFPLVDGEAVLHVPPEALLCLAGSGRIYAGAALYAGPADPAPAAIIRPDSNSVYVASGGFSGAGARQRFGFAGRPSVTGDASVAQGALRWAGDHPLPGATPVPDPASRRQTPVPRRVSGPTTEGDRTMNPSNGFMHRNAPYRQPMPVQPAQPDPRRGPPQVADYDDGYDTPPPPADSGNARFARTQPDPDTAEPAPSPARWDVPAQDSARPPQTATEQAWSQPLEYVLPEFRSYNPLDIVRTLSEAWSRYQSFTASVSDTRQFPFSSIVCLRVRRRRKSDGAEVGAIGTAFYIGPNLLLTAAHNFAESSNFSAAHSATLMAGLNSTRGPGALPTNSDAVSVETINPASAVTIHPLYTNRDPGVSRAHDLAVVRVRSAAPRGMFFRIADFTPSQNQKIAVCGYAATSKAQHNNTFDFPDLLPEARADFKQHMDADVIREVTNNGEGFLYNIQTLAGNSGSPVFIAPRSVQGDDPTQLMQVIAVHSSGQDAWRNHGVRLTPNKRDWALSGGQLAVQQSWENVDQDADHDQTGDAYAHPMGVPAWAPVVADLVGTATTAGIAGLNAASGDLTWHLQKMDGWLPARGHATPTITIPRAQIQTRSNVEINSPVYQGTLQGKMYAHFYLSFQFDGTGVGGILIEPAPYESHDNLTGGMRIDMQIAPLNETFPSMVRTGVQVACVEVRMMYTFEWTFDDNDQVTVIYRFYGDGTYESNVRGGSSVLSQTDTTYTAHPRSR